MKKYLSLLLLGLAVVLASGCYKNVRNVDPNDPNIFDPNNPPNPTQEQWDWVGTPPFSVLVDGVPFQNTLKTAEFSVNFGNRTVNIRTEQGDLFQFILADNMVSGEKYALSGRMRYEPAGKTPLGITGYQGFSGFLKVINVTDTEFEAMFYATVGNHQDRNVNLSEGYFKVPKKL